MAEGRRREDEEEELRERRELGGPRRARGRALPGHSAAGETRGARGPRPHEGGERLGPGSPWPLTHALPRAAAVLPAVPGGTDTFNSWRREGGTVAIPSLVSFLGAEPEVFQFGLLTC